MDRDHYISEAERQLGDSTYYKLLDHDPTPEFAKDVSEAINEMHDEGHISEKNRNYLLIDQPKAGRFYLLPKIHKAGNPGRPIVSAVYCTSTLSLADNDHTFFSLSHSHTVMYLGLGFTTFLNAAELQYT